MITNESLSYPIQLFRCHTRGNRFTDFCQCLGNQDGVFAKELNLLFSFRLNHNL